jgi:hypothetical protein
MAKKKMKDKIAESIELAGNNKFSGVEPKSVRIGGYLRRSEQGKIYLLIFIDKETLRSFLGE